MLSITLKDNKSDSFELITYPDGQHSIKLKLDKLNKKEIYEIKCRIKNFSELEILLCLIAACHKHDICINRIDFIYLYGMRSDRAFSIGEPNYFRDVLSPIINNLNINVSLYCFHSYSNMNDLDKSELCYLREGYIESPIEYSLSIGGDSSYRYYTDYNFMKNRTINGIRVTLSDNSLLEIESILNEGEYKNIIICDDLCDGGATFIAEAIYLREKFPKLQKLFLFVTHGIFSKGLCELYKHFDHIYTTNSYQDFDDYLVSYKDKLTVMEVI